MLTLTADYSTVRLRRLPKLHGGLDGLAHAIAGRRLRRLREHDHWQSQLAEIERLAPVHADLGGHALSVALREQQRAFRRGPENAIALALPTALALVVETAFRTLGLRPHPVQCLGALSLDQGCLVEMATGEGKSLVAALAAVLAAWRGRPCHVITVNDYLAERDATGFARFYEACGLSVAAVLSTHQQPDRLRGHAADITYTTGKELLADFLRDRLALGTVTDPARRHLRRFRSPLDARRQGCVLRGLGTAIVDEADSALIDEAVTPLIISQARPNAALSAACATASQIAALLKAGDDYRPDTRRRELTLTSAGKRNIAAHAAAFPGLWRGELRREELITRALEAREFFHAGKHYVVQDEKIVIVDEFTGRLMPGRTWRDGLHQAVEAKENVPVTPPTETVARQSFQRFFRLFPRLCGMTGTAQEEKNEFWRIYQLPVVVLPTHRPRRLAIHAPRLFATAEEKWSAVVAEIRLRQREDRPVLVGLRSVSASETLSQRLTDAGIAHQVLNALRHREEAAIIALAGGAGRVTLATNMAGRGTDIRLDEHVAASGGLFVIGTELHESARIDRQLMGRAGRQGDPGEAIFFLSADDELALRHLPESFRQQIGRRRWGQRLLRFAQKRAEHQAARTRRNVLKQDDWLDESLAVAGRDLV